MERRRSEELAETFEPPLQVLALCHIAVGQQMNLHWLHKVRAASMMAGRGEGRLEAIVAEEEPGHIIPSLGHRYNCSSSQH